MNDIALENLNNQKKILDNLYKQLRTAKLKASEKFTDDIGREMATDSLIDGIREKIDEEMIYYVSLLKRVQVPQQVEIQPLQINKEKTEHNQLVTDLLAAIKVIGEDNSQEIKQLQKTLNDDSKSTSLKLIGTLPIIPGILKLEGDIAIKETWLGLSNRVVSSLGENVNPQQPRQEPTLD